jgi:hypothetical protein
MKEDLKITEKRRTKELNLGSYSTVEIESKPLLEKLVSEGCESFYSYIDWLGLAGEDEVVVLPSSNHFYYAAEDLKFVKTIINLRQINRIQKIKEHLRTIYSVIPDSSYYLGFFTDSKNDRIFLSNKNLIDNKNDDRVEKVFDGIVSRIPLLNRIYDMVDPKHTRLLTKRNVTILLEDSGLKVIDMTELNGLTYFCTQKVK